MLFWQAILLEHITGDVESRYLYEVLAEASLVFPGVFPVMWVVNLYVIEICLKVFGKLKDNWKLFRVHELLIEVKGFFRNEKKREVSVISQ